MTKKHYEIPESELLLVRFEESFLNGTNPGEVPQPGTNDIDDEY